MKAILTKKLYTMAGDPLEQGMILIEDGKIAAVGQELTVPAGAEVIDLSAYEVTPGFIDAHAHMADFGIQTTADGNDFADPICPQMRLADGIDPTHFSFARTRLGGFTSCCQLPGSGNLMGHRLRCQAFRRREPAEEDLRPASDQDGAGRESPPLPRTGQRPLPHDPHGQRFPHA